MSKLKKYFYTNIQNRIHDNQIMSKLAFREVDTIDRLFKYFYNTSLKPNKITVDIGAGDGYLKKEFVKRKINYFGYDIGDLDIEKDPIPHEDNSVDYVINLGLIEALKNFDNLMNESYRILKKGGYIYTLTPNWKKDFKNFFDNPIHFNPIAPNKIESIYKIYNFKNIIVVPGVRSKSKFYYTGKYKFEKAYYLLPFTYYTSTRLLSNKIIKERNLIPEFLKGHARSIIAIGQKL